MDGPPFQRCMISQSTEIGSSADSNLTRIEMLRIGIRSNDFTWSEQLGRGQRDRFFDLTRIQPSAAPAQLHSMTTRVHIEGHRIPIRVLNLKIAGAALGSSWPQLMSPPLCPLPNLFDSGEVTICLLCHFEVNLITV